MFKPLAHNLMLTNLSIALLDRKNICSDKAKSGCSHLCFMLPAEAAAAADNDTQQNHNHHRLGDDDLYYCACPPESALDSDGKTCIVPDSMLLYSLDGAGLRRMSLPKSRLRQPQSRTSSNRYFFLFAELVSLLFTIRCSYRVSSASNLIEKGLLQ